LCFALTKKLNTRTIRNSDALIVITLLSQAAVHFGFGKKIMWQLKPLKPEFISRAKNRIKTWKWTLLWCYFVMTYEYFKIRIPDPQPCPFHHLGHVQMLMTTFILFSAAAVVFHVVWHAGEPGDWGEHGEARAARGGGQGGAAHGRVQACPAHPTWSRSSVVDPDP
jgi:hypothetical protein